MARKRKKRKSLVSPLATELSAAMKSITNGTRHIHPEIWARWATIAGDKLYTKTFPRFFRNGVLTIAVCSSAWMQQLNMMKQSLQDRLDHAVGPNVVTEIRFLLDTSIGKNIPKRPPVPKHAPPKPRGPYIVPDALKAAAASIDDEELRNLILKAASRHEETNE